MYPCVTKSFNFILIINLKTNFSASFYLKIVQKSKKWGRKAIITIDSPIILPPEGNDCLYFVLINVFLFFLIKMIYVNFEDSNLVAFKFYNAKLWSTAIKEARRIAVAVDAMVLSIRVVFIRTNLKLNLEFGQNYWINNIKYEPVGGISRNYQSVEVLSNSIEDAIAS